MTSKIKVDNINKVSDDTNIIKKCGTTTTIGSGASNPIVVDGSAVTLGRCGGTVALASGATQTGFGRTGTVDWQTTPKTATFTAVSGEGYFCNTSGGTFTVNLPAGSAGAIVSLADYTRTWQTNSLTVSPNGSEKIGGIAADASLSTEGQSVTLVYVDGTEGWINVQDSTSAISGFVGITATGGTITTSGNFKIHTFTGPGTFQVTALANCSSDDSLDYLVVAGGGSGATQHSGGGGAGGFRTSFCAPATPITATVASFPITVGAGGAQPGTGSGPSVPTNPGSTSTFSTISSAGGGGGGRYPDGTGAAGGSGGGGASDSGSGGAGNSPSTPVSQGNNGGNGATHNTSGGGGGGGGGGAAVGANAVAGASGGAGNGGAGAQNNICGNNYYWAGGGGGAVIDSQSSNAAAGNGGIGGGGGGANKRNSAGGAGGGSAINSGTAGGTQPSPTPGGPAAGGAGGANSGGGGGAGGSDTGDPGGAGGSGIVVIRYKFQ